MMEVEYPTDKCEICINCEFCDNVGYPLAVLHGEECNEFECSAHTAG